MKTSNMMEELKLFELQLFAEEGEGGSEEGEGGAGNGSEKGAESARTYTDDDVDKIVAKKKAAWDKDHQKALEAAKAEGARLARMDDDQKKDYEARKSVQELEKANARIRELEAREKHHDLSREASRILLDDHKIVATQDMLDFVVGEDSKSTGANIKKLVGIILADRKAQEEKRATGTTPRSFSGGSGGPVDPYEAIAKKYKR